MNEYSFCYLDDDHKTIELLKMYHNKLNNCCEDDQITIINSLDNEIQSREIHDHLWCNCIQEHSRLEAQIDWIKNHAKPFRSYLNSIKVLYLSLKVKQINIHEMTHDDFMKVKNEINKNKGILELIHT